MPPKFTDFALPLWIDSNVAGTEISLAGSLGPGLTLKELTKLSTDPSATAKAIDLSDVNFAGSTGSAGSQVLRERVAALYGGSGVEVTADDVIIANGTTGANMLVLQALIQPNDHVIAMYPTYGALLEIPKILQASMSYWRLNETNSWKTNLEDLKTLIQPSTRLLILNNPSNPTGLVLSTSEQADILELAAEHNITVHSDEIFRPLCHTTEPATSIVEHSAYDRTVATGSLSKAWCFAGLRVGWCVTRNPELKNAILGIRQWTLQGTSMADELLAQEILSERCREPIASRIQGFARENLSVLKAFLEEHQDTVRCTLPTGGSLAFVKFIDPRTEEPVDDLAFCRRLKEEQGVLLSPGSLCFGPLRNGDFRGYARVHITCRPEMFEKGLARISQFLTSESFANLEVSPQAKGHQANGTNHA